MPSGDSKAPSDQPQSERAALAREWRRLTRAATFVALLTSPVLFTLLYSVDGWSVWGARW